MLSLTVLKPTQQSILADVLQPLPTFLHLPKRQRNTERNTNTSTKEASHTVIFSILNWDSSEARTARATSAKTIARSLRLTAQTTTARATVGSTHGWCLMMWRGWWNASAERTGSSISSIRSSLFHLSSKALNHLRTSRDSSANTLTEMSQATIFSTFLQW